MNPWWLQPQFSFLPFIALALAVFLFIRARMRKKIGPLAEVLDGQQAEISGPVTPTLAGHFRGRKAAFVLTPGGKHTPPKFLIQLACGGSLLFEIYREDLGARFAKKLRLLKDVEIGDGELDKKLVFSCKEPEAFSRWMASQEVRRSVSSLLLERDVDRLALEDGRLQAVHFHYRATDLDAARVRSVLQEMETLVRTLESAR